MVEIPPSPPARDKLPSLSGLYTVLFELGRGGMGTVFLAKMAGVGGFERLVVVKRMNAALLARGDLIRRFLNEAKFASHVHHANVVGVQVIGQDPDGYFLVLDYVEGESLQTLARAAEERGEILPLPIVIRIALDGLAGLHAIHEARDPREQPLGILHRDVSTCNLLVGSDGVTRVTDFGVAKTTADGGIKSGDVLVGKALYMAPEYLLNQAVDRRIDLYAMGLVLWLVLARRMPWNETIPAQMMMRAVTDGVPKLPVGLVPPAVAAVVERACARDPALRFGTAREMAAALTKAASKSGIPPADQVDVSAVVGHLLGERIAQRRQRAGTLLPPANPSLETDSGRTSVEPRDPDAAAASLEVSARAPSRGPEKPAPLHPPGGPPPSDTPPKKRDEATNASPLRPGKTERLVVRPPSAPPRYEAAELPNEAVGGPESAEPPVPRLLVADPLPKVAARAPEPSPRWAPLPASEASPPSPAEVPVSRPRRTPTPTSTSRDAIKSLPGSPGRRVLLAGVSTLLAVLTVGLFALGILRRDPAAPNATTSPMSTASVTSTSPLVPSAAPAASSSDPPRSSAVAATPSGPSIPRSSPTGGTRRSDAAATPTAIVTGNPYR